MSWWNMDFEYLASPLQLPANPPSIWCPFFLQMLLFMRWQMNFWIRTFLQWPWVHLETWLLSVTMKIDLVNQWSSRGVMLQFFSLLFLCPFLVHMFPMLYPHFLVLYLLTICFPHDLLMLLCNMLSPYSLHTFASCFPHSYLMLSNIYMSRLLSCTLVYSLLSIFSTLDFLSNLIVNLQDKLVILELLRWTEAHQKLLYLDCW